MQSAKKIQIEIDPHLLLTVLLVLALHATFLLTRGSNIFSTKIAQNSAEDNKPFQVKWMRTLGAKDAKSPNSTYLHHDTEQIKKVALDPFSMQGALSKPTPQSFRAPRQAKDLLKESAKILRPDIAGMKVARKTINSDNASAFRPSDAISLSGANRHSSLSNSDVLVNLEVPEGVNLDELNEKELKFYSFQRRMAINYVNSFYNKLADFARKNPHLQFPMTRDKQIMTGRITFDSEGNVMQIKMIRWSNIDKLQDFFVEVLQGINSLPNPPRLLWEKSGEFSVFYSLVVNG